MPRIPVRTTPYHTLPRCTRHYKSKRDLILRALGKASFINGSQFVIAWISPKGEVDVYASELLQGAVSTKDGGVLNRKDLDREATRVRGEMGRRWEEIRRLEEKGEAPTMDEDITEEAPENEEMVEDEESEELDADRTMVEDGSSPLKFAEAKRPLPITMMSTFSAQRSSTPQPPMHTLNLAPDAIDNYYNSRFAALQQATCKLVVKAWIKVIEPKKQMKYPYNKGEDLKPNWWPEGVRHREPDHLSKTERLTLLSSIVRSPLISVSRLELSTAEAAAFISRPRLAILREVYLVGKEEERRRHMNDLESDLIVHMPNLPVSPSAVSPDQPEKRAHYDALGMSDVKDSMSVFEQHQQKRVKHSHRPVLASINSSYDNSTVYSQPFTFAPQPHLSTWRDGSLSAPPPHLSPYPHNSEIWSGSEYSRSPNPEDQQRYHPNHLAPILNPHSPIGSPAFSPSGTLSAPNSANFYPRSASAGSNHGYMQQQQMEYLAAHSQATGQTQTYDYGSPYLADQAWEGGYTGTA